MSQDVRFAVRLLTKQRGFTFAATLALALGIGMNATVFTLVNSFRSAASVSGFRSLAYVGERDTTTGRPFMVVADFQDWRAPRRPASSASAPGRPPR